ncbi:MAG: HlyC/CorC family transporter [Verrucomicrobia bacterium]|nr:HlyC/CorC family transporter [Verrucomicrobiota bacterium]
MSGIAWEIGIVLVLIMANGVFATAEMAFVAAKKVRLRKLADAGNASARVAVELAATPTRFLSTVQVGITLVGIIAGVFGGATLAEHLSRVLETIPWLAGYARPVSLTLVIAAITFLSLVVGELAPKRIALGDPEAVTLRLARPMKLLSVVAAPLITLLANATDLLLNLLGVRKHEEPMVNEEEIRMMIEQGHHAGVFHKAEIEMVSGVMRLDQEKVENLMTPRARIVWLNAADSDEVNWRKIVASNHTYFPVFERNRDNVIGLVSVKSMYANLAAGVPAHLRDLLTPPLVVPESMSGIKLLENFKQSGKHLAMVTDEFGNFSGLVTLIDVLEAIVGSLPGERERKTACQQRQDGSWLVDAMMDIDEFKRTTGIGPLPGDAAGTFQSLSGFIMAQLGRIPDEGEHFDAANHRFEVVDMDRHRIDKVLITPVAGRK